MMCAVTKLQIAEHLQPIEHIDLYIGEKMEPLEVARWLSTLQRWHPDRRYWIDGKKHCIKSVPREV